MPTNDETIVITGATAGVGRATAHAFARPGARIALLARGERGLAAVKREVEERHAQAFTIRTDVGDWAQVYAAARQVQETWGRIDVWVNNAMLTVLGPISALSPDDLRRVTDVTLRCELLHDRSDVHVTGVHLSAFNTPQFDWARNLTGRRAQPVPPIFQPELAAEAIVWAARHRRREVFVGWPAVKAVTANKIAPGLLDRYLAKSAYSGQFTDEPQPADACENLHSACDIDPGAHGRFDARARQRSVQWFITSHRAALIAVGIALAALMASYAAWVQ